MKDEAMCADPLSLEPLLERIADRLIERQATVAVAESLTGGLLGTGLTALAGSSAYFLGGVVAYADRIKVEALGVSADAVKQGTVVSERVAVAMAEGVRERFGADIALATTGLAGPGDGGTGLPVGLTYVALASPFETMVRRHQFEGSRSAVRTAAVRAALDLLDEWLQEVSAMPTVVGVDFGR